MPTTSKPNYFLRLPLETRHLIYTHLFASAGEKIPCVLDISRPENVYCKDYSNSDREFIGEENKIALLRTCKQILVEAKPVLYVSTLFQIEFYTEECEDTEESWKDLGAVEECDFLRHVKFLQLWVTVGKVNDQHERLGVPGSDMWPADFTAEMVETFVEIVGSKVRGGIVVGGLSVVYDVFDYEGGGDLVEVLRGFGGLRARGGFEVDVLWGRRRRSRLWLRRLGGGVGWRG
ncbi:hypothetical protein LTR78_003978 [Recurvomyces mirabilis]|uniref:Uncharacterized protein n=1 Tax=Recurvomyces mirabilis TaxID=574656 RepID=A0AAE1C307_9PEZI|nr:hypothetical protein LTR78_003978 [Recurvomyces mirabilis]KAK5153884.1 hypothetical protein LTS14_007104 [Recurvomyces mirabilis]